MQRQTIHPQDCEPCTKVHMQKLIQIETIPFVVDIRYNVVIVVLIS